MDLSIILTYRCQSRCAMCHVWRHPTLPAQEISPATLAKLPNGFRRITLTGGEPTLRADLEDVIALLRPKTRRLEISTNGLQTDKLERLVLRHPDIGIRISLEGLGAKNDAIRGERNGFERKRESLRRLAVAGSRRLGLAAIAQDDNADQLLEILKFAHTCGGDLDLTTLHNGYQFHKADNEFYNRFRTARALQPLAAAWLASPRPRDWARAFTAIGLAQKILGQRRAFPCPAGRDFLWLDPWGRVYACNVRPDLEIGDLTLQTWREILRGPRAAETRIHVARCAHNCWLPGHARAALRRQPLRAAAWILANRLRGLCRRPPAFEHAVHFADVAHTSVAPRRENGLDKPVRPVFQYKTEQPYGTFNHVMNK
jgi:Fe-coproporphyrin III synthase